MEKPINTTDNSKNSTHTNQQTALNDLQGYNSADFASCSSGITVAGDADAIAMPLGSMSSPIKLSNHLSLAEETHDLSQRRSSGISITSIASGSSDENISGPLFFLIP